ncbi:MAG: CopD family protein [Thermoleophilia bacterium]
MPSGSEFTLRPLPLGLLALLIVVVVALMAPASASAHAVAETIAPPPGTLVVNAPQKISLQYSEQIRILTPQDAQVVDQDGKSVLSGSAQVSPTDSRVLEIPLKQGLPDGTYTVRIKFLSADAHIIGSNYVFGVGPGPLAEPYLAGAPSEGPSRTGAWAVASRFAELTFLGGLFGLIAFRLLVWAPVWRRRPAAGDVDHTILVWGQDVLWAGTGILAVGAILAEVFLLIVYSAQVVGTTVFTALTDADGLRTTITTTRLGDLVQIRTGLLFAVFVLAGVLVMREGGRDDIDATRRAGFARGPALVLGGLVAAVMFAISAQGHASVAPVPRLQVTADAVHLMAVSTWVTGLALTALALWRLPRLGRGGRRRATDVLRTFSLVAVASLTLAMGSGVVRALGELSDPAQLWETGHGQSVLIKLVLLIPVGLLALYNRRILNTLTRMRDTSLDGLRRVRRAAALEFALAAVIVIVASVLVAQPPGRSLAREASATGGTSAETANVASP